MAATLNLPINNNLGFAYIVPFNNRKTGKVEAQFQIGYKGLIQLAQRSGQFERMVSLPIYECQLIEEDPINGFKFDWKAKPNKNELPIGYYAFFRLINGFTSELYRTTEQISSHAKQYSQTFKKGYGVWADNFEAMALKTVTKLLLSKQAPLSIDMQAAVLSDQSVIKNVINQEFDYIDNQLSEPIMLIEVDDALFNTIKTNISTGEMAIEEALNGKYQLTEAQRLEIESL